MPPPLPVDIPCLSIGKVCDGLYSIGRDLTGSFVSGCGDTSQCSKANPINCKTPLTPSGAGGDKYQMWCNDKCKSQGGAGCGGISIHSLNPQCYRNSVTIRDCQRLLH